MEKIIVPEGRYLLIERPTIYPSGRILQIDEEEEGEVVNKVNDCGQLLVELDEGEVIKVSVGDVRLKSH